MADMRTRAKQSAEKRRKATLDRANAGANAISNALGLGGTKKKLRSRHQRLMDL